MPPIQTSYADRPKVAFAGLVANMESQNSITRQNENNTGLLGFGHPVFQGVADNGILLPGGLVWAAASAARAGNTGNGVLTASPAVGVGAKEGKYTLVATEPGTDGGVFRFEDPDGEFLGTVKVGVAATLGGIGPFTVADGATDFVAGDGFDITVSTTTGGEAFRGITIADKTLVRHEGETVDTFRKGASVALLTAGVIWVVVGEAVKAGDPAYFNPGTGRFVAGGHVQLPNCSYDSSATTAGDLVKLRVSHF